MNEKLKSLLIDIFQVPGERINQETSSKTLPEWDSLATVNLVSGLEETFECTFTMDEMMRLTTVGDIQQLLQDKGLIA